MNKIYLILVRPAKTHRHSLSSLCCPHDDDLQLLFKVRLKMAQSSLNMSLSTQSNRVSDFRVFCVFFVS